MAFWSTFELSKVAVARCNACRDKRLRERSSWPDITPSEREKVTDLFFLTAFATFWSTFELSEVVEARRKGLRQMLWSGVTPVERKG